MKVIDYSILLRKIVVSADEDILSIEKYAKRKLAPGTVVNGYLLIFYL